jgi:hypothetical protein
VGPVTRGWAASPARPVSEADFQSQVLDHFHVHDSRRSPHGFPDLVLCRPPELVFAELKSATGRLTAEQSAWLELLRACGQRVFCWRPADWAEITATLARRRT